MQDWYIGLPPDREENLRHKIGLLERGVAALQSDGVHLGFIRWPGFWETWLTDVNRSTMPDYCYSPMTLGGFVAQPGQTLPPTILFEPQSSSGNATSPNGATGNAA